MWYILYYMNESITLKKEIERKMSIKYNFFDCVERLLLPQFSLLCKQFSFFLLFFFFHIHNNLTELWYDNANRRYTTKKLGELCDLLYELRWLIVNVLWKRRQTFVRERGIKFIERVSESEREMSVNKFYTK